MEQLIEDYENKFNKKPKGDAFYHRFIAALDEAITKRDFECTVKLNGIADMFKDELIYANNSLLHFATMKNRVNVAKHLLERGADANAQDGNGATPLHIAANGNYEDLTVTLLANGADCNAVDNLGRKPLEVTTNEKIVSLISFTEKLLSSAKENNCVEVEANIKAGAIVNARYSDSQTPLHYAAREGLFELVDILLKNGADPNIVNKERVTPLHYASEFSHLKIVKALLSNGAMYDALTVEGKTACDLAGSEDVANVLQLINNLPKTGRINIASAVGRIKNADTRNAVLNARNKKGESLNDAIGDGDSAATTKSKPSTDFSAHFHKVNVHVESGQFEEALKILRGVLEERKRQLGPDHRDTIDVQTKIACVLFKQGMYKDSYDSHEEIFKKQRKLFGVNDIATIDSQFSMALLLHCQAKDQEAIGIFSDVFEKQSKILGREHYDTSNTQFHMVLVLERLGRYDEALAHAKEVFNRWNATLGPLTSPTVRAENNIALVLNSKGMFNESLDVYKNVLEKKKKVFGMYHTDYVRTLFSIGGVYGNQKNEEKAMEIFEEVLKIQKHILPENHPEILNTQYNLASGYLTQKKWITAVKIYREILQKRVALYGPNHFTVLSIVEKLNAINSALKSTDGDESDVLLFMQKELNIAASHGKMKRVTWILNSGADPNEKDIEGRTTLHHAVNGGHLDIVKILLKHGANPTLTTDKGNTALHTAASKGFTKIVDLLLNQVSLEELNGFVNAKTFSGGTTALHVAAKLGSLKIVQSLLSRGAMFGVKNNEGQQPIDLSSDREITALLNFLLAMFDSVRRDSFEIADTFGKLRPSDFNALSNARDTEGKTLLQVAIGRKNKTVASALLKMLKKSD